MSEERAKRIAALNDLFRLNLLALSSGPHPVPGQIVCTRGISALPPETQIRIWAAVSNFNTFEEDDDPYGDHDFGVLRAEGVPEKIFWKIDYYADKCCTSGSEDATDPAQCFRILTIMLDSDY